MNEVPAGLQWPGVAEQQARTAEALEAIARLLDGETVDFEGQYFRTQGARLYLDNENRPPVFMSGFGPRAAAIAGKWAGGVWALGDPKKAPAVIAAYKKGAEAPGANRVRSSCQGWCPRPAPTKRRSKVPESGKGLWSTSITKPTSKGCGRLERATLSLAEAYFSPG